MTWMLTVTGATVHLRNPQAADISTLDIAHSLSLTNRFTGHTLRPYSVAEHSLLVEEIMSREFGPLPPTALLAALVHDSHEAYLGDISTPLKQAMGAWKLEDVEAPLWYAVQTHFGTGAASRDYASIIKRCDLMALAMERRDLLPEGGPAWPLLHDVQPCTWVNLNQRAGMDWQDWRQAFIDRVAALLPQVD
jgi:uncharacterized protein